MVTGLRRTITAMFCDLSNSTAIAETLELEKYELLLDEIRSSATKIIEDLGGTIIRIDGDGILSVFGYPVAFENSTRRAIDTGIRLNEWSREYTQAQSHVEQPISFHTGINTGLVLLKEGDLERGRYEILGDTTNVASRLGSLAEAGEILISADSLGSDRHYYETSLPQLTDIRSRARKLYVCKVFRPRSDAHRTPSNLRHNLTRLVGRERELQTAVNFFEDETGSNILSIRAAAGLGKSRFLSELRQQSQRLGYPSIWSYCDPYEGQSPLAPISQIFRGLRRLMRSAAEELSCSQSRNLLKSEFWSQSEKPGSDLPATRPQSLVKRFAEAVEIIRTHHSGLVIFMDDWHWADRSSREIVDILRDMAGQDYFLVIAERYSGTATVKSRDSTCIELEDLGTSDARKLIQQIEPSLDKLVVDNIIERAGGNPLYIEELSYAARLNLGASADLQSDSWLHSLIQARFDLLSGPERNCLQIAAAIGRVVPDSVFRNFIAAESKEKILRTLSERDFLHPDEVSGSWKFKHGITVEAIYNHISGSLRKKINGQIAEWTILTEEHPDPALLAKYFFRSGDIERAISFAIDAGKSSLRELALDRAQFHLMSALKNAVAAGLEEGRIVGLLKLYGQASVVDPSWGMAADLQSLEKQYGTSGLPIAAVWAQYFLGFIRYGLGQLDHAIEEFQTARSTAEELGERAVCLRAESTLGQVFAAACRGRAAISELEKSLNLQRAKQGKAAATDALGYTLGAKGMLLMDMGEIEEARKPLQEVARLVDGSWNIASLSVRSFLGASAIIEGNYAEAESIFSAVIAHAEKSRSHFHLAQSGTFLGLARLFLTRDAELLIEIETAAEQWALQSDHHLSIPYGYLAELFAQTSDWLKARHYADKALERAGHGDRYGETMAHRALASLAHDSGDDAAVARELRAAYQSARERESQRALCLTGHLEQELGRVPEVDWEHIARTKGVRPEAIWLEPVSQVSSR